MALVPQLLAQSRPADALATDLYSPGVNEEVVAFLFISNSSGESATARVYVHNTGTTKDETTHIEWDRLVRPGLPVKIGPITLNNPSGSIGIKSSVGDALTFTLMGMVKT